MGTEKQVYWHVVFQPYKRSPLLWEGLEDDFYQYVNDVAGRMGFSILRIKAMPDHVHLLIALPPWLDLIEAIRQTKGHTAKRLLDKRPDLRSDVGGRGFWAEGYHYVKHTQASLPAVLKYIDGQQPKDGLV